MTAVQWHTPKEVATRWGVHPNEIRKLIRSRRLGAMVVNPAARRPTYRISETQLTKYERQQERRTR